MPTKVISWVILSVAFLMISCKAQPKKSDAQYVVVELIKGLDETYLLESYAGYSPTKVKRSNRTLNRYGTHWILSDIQYRALIKKLSSDSNVVQYIEDEKNISPPSNSQNIGKAKATPVRKGN